MILLIQGVFYQHNSWLGFSYSPTEGNVAVIKRGLLQTMYHGVIYPEDQIAGPRQELVGTLSDHYGSSRLQNIAYNPGHSLLFTKRYERRQDAINYEFRKGENGLWLGTYKGSDVGTGVSVCVLTEVDPLMFDPVKVAEMVEQPTAHS